MDHGHGIESPAEHPHAPQRSPVRFLVVIDSAGSALARLFVETREQVAEIDAGTEEVATMTTGLVPERSAGGPEWDRALQGHSLDERRAADVYTLPI